jgi:hypothetical protein
VVLEKYPDKKTLSEQACLITYEYSAEVNEECTPDKQGMLDFGNTWTRGAVDADTKMIIARRAGLRTEEYAQRKPLKTCLKVCPVELNS